MSIPDKRSTTNYKPLLVLVGETGSGKSALAMELAERFNGEIICADSRTVYKGMDIGTAKPSTADRQRVRHHLLDVVTPNQTFTVAEFKGLANEAIVNITARGKLPIMVGGTGLYVDAVLYDFEFRPVVSPEIRAGLEKLSVAELQEKIIDQDIPLPADPQNPRRLIRTLETNGAPSVHKPLRHNTLILGLRIKEDELLSRITQRVDKMIATGFVDEVKGLAAKYGWDIGSTQAPGYKAFRDYLTADIDIEEAKALFIKNDMHLAKRQRTWFKRNKDIQWVEKQMEAVELVTTLLNT